MMMNCSQNADTQFEAAFLDGANGLEVVKKRRGAAILLRLPRRLRRAVEVYAGTFEAVQGGGATVPRSGLDLDVAGGAGVADGRQMTAIDQVRFLKVMDKAVNSAPIQVGKRNPIHVKPSDLWRYVCLQSMSMETVLSTYRLKPAKSRIQSLNEGFTAIATRVADAIDKSHDPYS